jgi:hypothetical protein
LASSETYFDENKDSLFNFEIVNDAVQQISLSKLDFVKYGHINSWLTSDIFGLSEPRALQAEKIINQARQLQLQDNLDKEQVDKVHRQLLNELSADDPFWPRWIYFAEKNGVQI